ncbi:MAG TPA: glycosyltransferase family 2 protein, partial [Desulfurococcaceae archaeon]|nr:glycosyltransferase family 2 protein [Desulfurococcaceae archaeon]
MELSIVIPTYNEAENIATLIEAVTRYIDASKHEIILVDDNSPDNTWLQALRLIPQLQTNIVVMRRIGIKGLSTAIIDGIVISEGEYALVMDADLQHPPEYIPSLLQSAKSRNADIVIGSRYTKGGGVEGWPKLRLLISKTASLIAKLLLPEARKLSDPMSGFFLVKRYVVLQNRKQLSPKGFKVLLEILVKCKYERVVEVPYVFRSRLRGYSKLGYKQILLYLLHILNLCRWRPFKFALVGAGGTLVNLGMLFVLGLIAPSLINEFFIVGSALAIEVSTLFNFTLHDMWTFRDRRHGSIARRLILFHFAVIPAIITQYGIANFLKYFLN